ncbi:MAG: DUF1501 domain-containing protein [Pseudomonadota bacterium]|nr:DUF1501 domain-containing protein [Pseudomonadota bacterium]
MAKTAVFLARKDEAPQTLVVVFLRGAADGLNLVIPVEDDDYYRARPLLSVPKSSVVPLNGLFGLHPHLGPLEAAYRDGQLTIVHAAGSEDSTRSHFEAQDLMEHGGITAGGWLGRFLRYGGGPSSSALAAVAMSSSLPESLRGAPGATALQSLDQFSLGDNSAAYLQQLKFLYEGQNNELALAGHATLKAMSDLDALRNTVYRPEIGAEYGADDFSSRLRQVAQLIKSGLGLRAATIDIGGWDSHFMQTTVMDPLMLKLANGLSSFYRDLGQRLADVSLVVMTEFGRRVQENSSFGTDHGRGSVMFVMGGGTKGGRMAGAWPGLKRDRLEGPGDVAVIHNYRDVLAPVLRRHGAASALNIIFPHHDVKDMDI